MQDPARHVHDLQLLRLAVADDCRFDLQRRIFMHRYAVLFLVRTVSAAVTAVLMSLLSGCCKSQVTAYIVNISVFVLPAALALLGVSAMRYIGVNPILSYNPLAELWR